MYIIDGYNLLKLVERTSDEFEGLSQAELCLFIAGFMKIMKQQGVVVFDGVNPDKNSNFKGMSNLEVIFAGGGKDADSLIEKKIEYDTAPKRLFIVSNDRRIKNAARARGCSAVNSDKFWLDLQKAMKKKRNFEPDEKRRGLDEAQTKYWMEYFDLEQ